MPEPMEISKAMNRLEHSIRNKVRDHEAIDVGHLSSGDGAPVIFRYSRISDNCLYQCAASGISLHLLSIVKPETLDLVVDEVIEYLRKEAITP